MQGLNLCLIGLRFSNQKEKLKALLEEREERIESLESKNAEVVQGLEQQAVRIAELDESSRNLAASEESLKALLAERDERIESLEREGRRNADETGATLKQQDARIAELEQSKSTLTASEEKLKAHLAQSEERVESLEREARKNASETGDQLKQQAARIERCRLLCDVRRSSRCQSSRASSRRRRARAARASTAP